MGKKLVWMILLLVALGIGITNVKAYHIANPICNYLLVGPSNISDAGQTQNQTFKAVIETTSNQTSSSTFVRLQNQNGYTLFTNTTGRMINGTGETASYEVQWAPTLDAQKYSLSAAFFFLNNTFVNYSITQANCVNRTFTVYPVSGGYVVQQQQQQIITELTKGKDSTTTIIIIAGLALVLYMLFNKK